MDINEFVREASRTDAPLNSSQEHDFHMILGMFTEVGELADIFKKNLAYSKSDERKIDWVNVREEVGDLMWYIANFCNMHDFRMEDIFETTINKLRVRYPEKFTEEKANNRDLGKEREILENGIK